jgi:hypothetical protein
MVEGRNEGGRREVVSVVSVPVAQSYLFLLVSENSGVLFNGLRASFGNTKEKEKKEKQRKDLGRGRENLVGKRGIEDDAASTQQKEGQRRKGGQKEGSKNEA